MSTLAPDPPAAASHRSAVDHLTAPLAAGAVTTPLAIDATGTAAVDWPARHALLLLAPAAPVDAAPLTVTATVSTGEAVTLVFAPYTEAGASLVLHAVPPDAEPAPLTVALSIEGGGDPAALLSLDVVEGILGRTLYALGAEKARIRREGREITAMRLLARARDGALDRIGAELAVPRFADALHVENHSIASLVQREADDDYRRRLGLFRRLFLRTKDEVLQLLNGPGADGDPNAGAIGELAQSLPAAYTGRFLVTDTSDDFAVGIKLVAAGDPAFRDNFLAFVRAVYLIWPGTSAAANAAHAGRFLPAVKRDRESALRADLRALFDFGSFAAGPEPALAPLLAAALVRAGRCIQALVGPSPWPLYRAQHPDAGSRYELGLGVDARRLTSPQLNAMKNRHAALKAADPTFGQVVDAETRGLLREMQPVSAAADPDGTWLLGPCGLRTVHRIPKPTGAPFDLTFLSHFPIFGLTVTEVNPTPAVDVGGWTLATAGSALGPSPERMFAYERDLGIGQVWSANGGLSQLSEQAGLPKTFTHVVPGSFTPAREEGLFLYDPSTGGGRLELIDETGALRTAGTLTALGTTWTHVVAGDFGRDLATDVVFYDAPAGVVARYRPDGAGGLALQQTTSGFRETWSHLIAARRVVPAELVCYDDAVGEAAFFRVDNSGRFVQDGPLVTGLRRGWTHVVPCLFSPDAKGVVGVLFYDRTSGEAALYDDRLQPLSTQAWRPGWSEIVPIENQRSGLTVFALYNRVSGRGELWTTSGGALVKVRDVANLPRAGSQRFQAQFNAPGDPGSNIALAGGLTAAGAAWTAQGRPAWAVTTAFASQKALWEKGKTHPAPAGAVTVFRAVGLPAIAPADVASVLTQLEALPPQLVSTLTLAPAQSTAILANAEGAADDLGLLVELLREQQLTSVLPLVTGAHEVVLAVGVIPLPVAGINLYERITSGFRWYVVPLEGPPGQISPLGSRTAFTPAGPGLSAIVVIGYARTGANDPYEFDIDLPDGALLTLGQYEFLMNLLQLAHPAGVLVNTYSIRRSHVDWEGVGAAEPLDPMVANSFRAFRRPRHRGETSVTVDTA